MASVESVFACVHAHAFGKACWCKRGVSWWTNRMDKGGQLGLFFDVFGTLKQTPPKSTMLAG